MLDGLPAPQCKASVVYLSLSLSLSLSFSQAHKHVFLRVPVWGCVEDSKGKLLVCCARERVLYLLPAADLSQGPQKRPHNSSWKPQAKCCVARFLHALF